MRIGVDSYSYHRLLGELRPGETPGGHLPHGGFAVIAEARRRGIDGVALETCFLGAPDVGVASELAAAAQPPLELVFAWGAPNGLEFGASPGALAALPEWIDAAAAAGTRTLRIVIAGPALRGREPIVVQLDLGAGG